MRNVKVLPNFGVFRCFKLHEYSVIYIFPRELSPTLPSVQQKNVFLTYKMMSNESNCFFFQDLYLKIYSSTIKPKPAGIILCVNGTDTQFMLELPNHHSPSSVPLASSAVLSLSLSLSIPSLCFPLCVRFTLPPCLSASECPGLLPVCFIKPVRDEVKS